MDKRKSSCVMLLVVCLLILLHCDQTSWAYACAVAEFVDNLPLNPTLEINTLEFPNEDVLPTGYNITVICTSNFSKENWGYHYYGQPYWIQQFFNDDYIGYCGGGDGNVDSEDSKVCTYVIQNSTEEDSGNYSCVSRNQMTCTEDTVYLDFKKPAPPRFKVDLPLHFNVSAGSNTNLSCSTSGVPRPVITWFKDGHRMPMSSVTGVKGSSVLTFQSVRRNDTGKYWCEAKSSEGWNKSSVVNLAVLWRPVFLIHPESSFRHLDDGVVKVTLFCEASGFPRPMIGWLKNNLPVTNGTVMTNGSISSLVVVFSEATEEPPKYRCVARNSLGSTLSIEATVTLTKGNANGKLNHHSAAHPTDGPVTSDGVPTLVWTSVGAVAFLLIMAMAALVLFKWKRGKKSTYQLNKEIIKSQHEFIELQLKENEDAIDQLRNSQSTVSENSSGGTHASTDENEVVDNEMYLQGMTVDRNWEIPQDRLFITEERLGGGEFGIVTKGIYLRTDGNELPVAVKRLKDNTDQQQRLALISELETLIHVGRHPNIVSLVGACSFEEPLCIIIEFVAGGSLDNLLRSSRVQTKRDNPSYTNIWSRLTERELLKMSSDVANGMRHLESKLCIHRDLACRNVLVGSGLVAKVADFGMARDISTDGQYIKTTEGRIPWLWMSMEALRGTYTTKGDVWSFGVVLWEIVTLGKLPYRGVKGVVELHEQLLDGVRLQKPPHCSDELYNIMLQCWQKSPDDRPSFIELHEKLQKILNEETRMYINIKHVDGQKTEYHEQGISV